MVTLFPRERYIKAIETIKKVRKAQADECKGYETEIKYLKANLERAQEMRKNLEGTAKEIRALEMGASTILEEMEPLEQQLQEIARQAQRRNRIENDLGRDGGPPVWPWAHTQWATRGLS